MRCFAIALFATGCIDGFSGSNVQFDFAPPMPVQAAPGATPKSDELPSNIHFKLYAFDSGTTAGRLFEIQRFEIHRIVQLDSPCFIDVGEHVPHPGLHVTQYQAKIAEDTGITDVANPPSGASEQDKIDAATAVQRQMNVAALSSDMGIKVVSSASTKDYPAVSPDCSGALPPPTCMDDDSNRRRLAACQAAWRDDPDHYEGTDRVLTEPLNGTMYGTVVGMNPVNLAPVGGAQFFVDEVLDGFTGYAVYWQFDDADGDGAPDYPASFPMAERSNAGQLLLFGKPSKPTRGITHVHMTSTANPLLTAELAIFADLSEDDVQF